jgi:hypothetical protein
VLVALDFSANLARDRFQHMVILLNWRRILGILMLFLATAVLVPISFTCAILASESPVTHGQVVRLAQASHRIGVLALVLQIIATLLFLGKPFGPLRFVGLLWDSSSSHSSAECYSLACWFTGSGEWRRFSCDDYAGR